MQLRLNPIHHLLNNTLMLSVLHLENMKPEMQIRVAMVIRDGWVGDRLSSNLCVRDDFISGDSPSFYD